MHVYAGSLTELNFWWLRYRGMHIRYLVWCFGVARVTRWPGWPWITLTLSLEGHKRRKVRSFGQGKVVDRDKRCRNNWIGSLWKLGSSIISTVSHIIRIKELLRDVAPLLSGMIYRRNVLVAGASIKIVARRREIFDRGLVEDNITRDNDLSRMDIVEPVVSIASVADELSLGYI